MATTVGGQREIRITIKADDKTGKAVVSVSNSMKKLDREMNSVSGRMRRQFQTIQKNWLAVGVAITAAIASIRKAWDLADMAAVVLEQTAALDALGAKYDQTASSIVASTQKAARGLISIKDATDLAARSLALGFSPQQLEQLTITGERFTDVIGGSVSEAVLRMAKSIATGETEALKTMGITVRLSDVYKKFAEQLGKTEAQLTLAQRKQALFNEVAAQTGKIVTELGPPVDTIKDKMDRLQVQMDDFQLFLGQFAIRGLAIFKGILETVAAIGITVARLLTFPLAKAEELYEQTFESLLSSSNAFLRSLAVIMGKGAELVGFDYEERVLRRLDFMLEANVDKLLGQAEDAFRLGVASLEDLAAGTAAPDALALDDQAETEQRVKIAEALRARLAVYEAAFEKFNEAGKKRIAADADLNAKLGELFLTEFDLRREAVQAEFEELSKNATDKVALEVWRQGELQRIRDEESADKAEKAQEDFDRELALWDAKVTLASQSAGDLATIFRSLAESEAGTHEGLFKVYKAFAAAQALIDSYRAFNIALATLPPPWSYIQAGISLAMGLARVRAILAQQPTASASASAGGVPTSTVAPPTAAPATDQQRPIAVTVHVAGSVVSMDQLGRDLVPVIEQAVLDGVG